MIKPAWYHIKNKQTSSQTQICAYRKRHKRTFKSWRKKCWCSTSELCRTQICEYRKRHKRHSNHEEKKCWHSRAHEKMFNTANHLRNANQNPVRHHLTPLRMALMEKNTNSKFVQYCAEGNLTHCWCKWKLVQPLWKTVLGGGSRKAKLELPNDPAMALPGIYPNTKTLIRKDTGSPMFTAAEFTCATWNQLHLYHSA